MDPADRAIINTIMANWGKAIAAYERRLVSRNSALERYALGDRRALSAAAKRGLKLFIGKAACDACHKGPIFTDNEFHDTGVPQSVGEHVPAADTGRFGDIPKLLSSAFNGAGALSDDRVAGAQKLAGLATDNDGDRGKFRTKNLMNIALTGPYMHNGSLETLEDVVHFYNLGGGERGFAGVKDPKIVPLLLSEAEEQDLVAFLHTLTGEPVAGALREDTSAK
jgi:cytochrome c peroxidase